MIVFLKMRVRSTDSSLDSDSLSGLIANVVYFTLSTLDNSEISLRSCHHAGL